MPSVNGKYCKLLKGGSPPSPPQDTFVFVICVKRVNKDEVLFGEKTTKIKKTTTAKESFNPLTSNKTHSSTGFCVTKSTQMAVKGLRQSLTVNNVNKQNAYSLLSLNKHEKKRTYTYLFAINLLQMRLPLAEPCKGNGPKDQSSFCVELP